MMRRFHSAFTLIELLIAIAIIGMLAALLAPLAGRSIGKAQSAACASNLRQIALAAQGFAQDNDGRFPVIEAMPSNPVYGSGTKAGTLLAVLGPYGLTDATLRCRTDLARQNYYKKEGSSYMWRPFVDDELVSSPKIYRPRIGEIVPPLSRLPLASDFTNVHNGHINCVFADGHARLF